LGVGVTSVICTEVASTSRGLPAAELAETASEILGGEHVETVPRLADAIERAVTLADESGPTAGVLIAGSVILAGEARALLVRENESE
jgi:dihydrofolate synthase/folylpolyglutamate synthase